MNFCHFARPWKKIFGYAWKNPLSPTGKNPSDAHESDYIKYVVGLSASFKKELHIFSQ